MKMVILIGTFVFSCMSYAQTTSQEQLYTIEQVEKIKVNSTQPVLYGIGAAGITLNTSYDDASTVLAPPAYESEQSTVYAEGVDVYWNTESKKPAYILVLSTYLGEIQVAPPYESFKMNEDFSKKYSTNNMKAAEQMTRDLFVMFEKKSENVDCLSEKLCRLIWGENSHKEFIVELPGMTLLFSKDRYVLYRLLIK